MLAVGESVADRADAAANALEVLLLPDDGPGQVCVVGSEAARKLFAFNDPLSQSVRVRDAWSKVVGIVAALWSASGYVGAFMRASNIIYETPEGRPIWKLRPLQLLVTLIGVVLTSLVPSVSRFRSSASRKDARSE